MHGAPARSEGAGMGLAIGAAGEDRRYHYPTPPNTALSNATKHGIIQRHQTRPHACKRHALRGGCKKNTKKWTRKKVAVFPLRCKRKISKKAESSLLFVSSPPSLFFGRKPYPTLRGPRRPSPTPSGPRGHAAASVCIPPAATVR